MSIFVNMNKIAIIFVLSFFALCAFAQRELVVCDVETYTPISDVSVRTNAGVEITDSVGRFTVTDSCKTMIFTHLNYESRMLDLSEVHDTIFLVSKEMSIREVVVFGTGKDDSITENMKKQMKLDKTEAQLLAIDPSSGGNLLGIIKYILPKSKKSKRKNKAKEILENY